MAELFLQLMEFIKTLVMSLFKIINLALYELVQLLLLVLPSSLGVLKPAQYLNQAHSAFPMFPWSVVADLFGFGCVLLTFVLGWKAFAAIWP